MTDIPWSTGRWTHEPESVDEADGSLIATAREGSDAWRTTSYGFVHDTEHALLAPLAPDSAVEVSFRLDFAAQFDQAGVFLRVDDETWIKAGVEHSDGVDGLGAVVTRGVSDWSLAPVQGWAGRIVTVRASRSGDAVTVRARVEGAPGDDGDWRLVRVAPLAPTPPSPPAPSAAPPPAAGCGSSSPRGG